MAIPTDASNQGISLLGMKEELENNVYVSLRSLASSYTINQNSANKPTFSGEDTWASGREVAMKQYGGYDHDAASSFVNAKAVSKTSTTGTLHNINFVDTDDTFNFRGGTEWTISFWIKAGWTSSLNTNIHLLIGQKQNGAYQLSDMIKIMYNESNNRLRAQYGNKTTSSDAWYKLAEWLFHANYGVYQPAYAAAGLGTSYWSSSNRGYVNSDNYSMITITKSTTNAASAMKLYWNANAAGAAPIQTNFGSGSPVMSATNNRSWSLGSNGVINGETKCGNGFTVYNDLSIFQKELSASEVTELYNSGTAMDVTTHSAANKLKGYWKFEGNGNATTSNDNFSVNGQSSIVDK